VLAVIRNEANAAGECFLSVAQIAERANIGRTKARAAIRSVPMEGAESHSKRGSDHKGHLTLGFARRALTGGYPGPGAFDIEEIFLTPVRAPYLPIARAGLLCRIPLEAEEHH
jgi:hypothetical protein